ncbi:hypothetical protein [Melissospora conviva]|uniref:hypothetical protein n=1 Tax=Melissospora conviva TaxID=3388432 RepID=UPI003B764180
MNQVVRPWFDLPVWMFWCALVLSTGLPVIALLMEGKYSFAALAIAGNLYAAGLGRRILWERLGRPPAPDGPGGETDN